MAVSECRRIIEEDTIVPALTKKKKTIETKINNLLKFFEDGSDSISVRNRINKLEEEKIDLDIRIEIEKNNFIYLRKEQVVWWLERFTKGDIEDINFKRNFLDIVINSVTIQELNNNKKDYKFIITYNLDSIDTQI